MWAIICSFYIITAYKYLIVISNCSRICFCASIIPEFVASVFVPFVSVTVVSNLHCTLEHVGRHACTVSCSLCVVKEYVLYVNCTVYIHTSPL